MPNPKVIDTDHIRDWRELRDLLEQRCVRAEHGCLLYPDKSILVRVRGGHAKVSPSRVAWALANQSDHLSETDLAVHICPHHPDDLHVCCEPAHIRKGTTEDVTIMAAARKRGLILGMAVSA